MSLKTLFAAGGTGGHLFPAVAVAESLKLKLGDNFSAKFIGSQDRMESRLIPELGYEYAAMPIVGFKGIKSPSTLTLPFKILKSISIAKDVINNFKPEAVVCTGAYISYPAGIAAFKARIPLFLMESNVNPGKTIKTLSSKATAIICAFEETKNYFPDEIRKNIFVLGNPVRNAFDNPPSKKTALDFYGLESDKKTLLIFGGSLGAKSINIEIEKNIGKIIDSGYQVIWQTGANYKPSFDIDSKSLKIVEFIKDMATAYSAADLVISRSGATSVAEICLLGKPSILIPLETASNDEQSKNAAELKKLSAAIVIKNADLPNLLLKNILDLLSDSQRLDFMSQTALKLGRPNAASDSANLIIDIIGKQ